MNLRHLTDKTLLKDMKQLVEKERDVSLKVLHHLKEIEKRRLFSDLSYGSLFDYCVRELGYSESSAARRVHGARLLADIPELEPKIESGLLNLTHLAMASNLFKTEDIKDREIKIEVLAKIENTTKKECQKTLMDYSRPNPKPREIIKVVSEELTTVKMNFSNETMALLDEIKSLLASHRLNNDDMMRSVFQIAIERIKAKKFKLNAKFSSPVVSPSEKRYIPAIIKKQVYLRDGGKCQKCGSLYKLEYDHVKPFAQGGPTSVDNLRLLCFSCNQRRLKRSSC